MEEEERNPVTVFSLWECTNLLDGRSFFRREISLREMREIFLNRVILFRYMKPEERNELAQFLCHVFGRKFHRINFNITDNLSLMIPGDTLITREMPEGYPVFIQYVIRDPHTVRSAA